jgi:hypothetical protein
MLIYSFCETGIPLAYFTYEHTKSLLKRKANCKLEETMTAPAPGTGTTFAIPSEFDDEIDDSDASLRCGYIWAYPCKHPSCPDYGKSWTLRSNFLLHLQEEAAHMGTAATPAERRAIEILWRYPTDLHLPPRAPPYFRSREEPEEHQWTFSFRDKAGGVLTRTGTQREMDRTCRDEKEETGTSGGRTGEE